MRPLCDLVEETISHLFVECKIAFQVWLMVSKWVGKQSVYHSDMKHHLLQIGLFQFNEKKNRAWKGVWVAVIWSICNQRNCVVFKEGKVDAEEIFSLTQLLVWSWMRRKITNFNFSFSDWVIYPLNCLHSLS